MASKIDPKMISTDCGTQLRIEMSESVIADYAEAMERGDEFPAILVFYDEAKNHYILVDGFHRYHAHMKAKPNDPILAEQHMGTAEAAQWASLAANKSHGLQRTNADKRNAIKRALIHPRGCQLSNRKIAKHVGVNDKTVAALRCELESTAEIPQSELRRGLDGRTINTQRIGNNQKTEPQPKAYCVHCINYSDQQTCTFDGSIQVPWTPACDEFEAIPPEPERRVVPPVTNDYKIIEPPDRSKKPKTSGQYKPRNTLAVDIPLDNPQLAACELREAA